MFVWTTEENDLAIVCKVAKLAKKLYFFSNFRQKLIGLYLLFMAFGNLIIEFTNKRVVTTIILAVSGGLLLYFLSIAKKTADSKRSVKYVKKNTVSGCGEHTLELSNNNIVLDGVTYGKKNIYAVFLMKNYAIFTLTGKQSFLVKIDECKDVLYQYIYENKIYAYSWDKANRELTRRISKRDAKTIIPLCISIILVFSAFITIKTIENKNAVPDTSKVFTFSMYEEMSQQFADLFDYYLDTRDFETTNDIYYSYLRQAANVLYKTNYRAERVPESREYLFTDKEFFYYVKCNNPDIINGDTVEIITWEQGLALKDGYKMITEYDYLTKEFPVYDKAFAYFMNVNFKFRSRKLFKKNTATFRIGRDSISLSTDSGSKDYEILLGSISFDEMANIQKSIRLEDYTALSELLAQIEI